MAHKHQTSNHTSSNERLGSSEPSGSDDRSAILRWVVRLGAVTADALAQRNGLTVVSARARLTAAERAGLLCRRRLLTDQPALYAATRAGVRASGLTGFEPCCISVANAAHTLACARVAAALERAYPDHSLMGERELRRDEREFGAAIASACFGVGRDGAALLHRPDLVLWPHSPRESLPVAVEIELTVKAPRRLLEICRAWARCRCVAGTLYLAGADVRSPLARAITRAGASERIVVVELDQVVGSATSSRLANDSYSPNRARTLAPARTVPSDA
jgi:hypothetical protein